MKKTIKTILFGSLLAAGMASLIHLNTNAARGGRGGGMRGGGGRMRMGGGRGMRVGGRGMHRGGMRHGGMRMRGRGIHRGGMRRGGRGRFVGGRRHWGGGWRRRPYWRHGRRWWGYRRPYWWGGGPYWGIRRDYYYDDAPIYDWKDSQGKMSWEVTNSANRRLTVESDIEIADLSPGESVDLRRGDSFEIIVKSNGAIVERTETDNHYVELHGGGRIRSYTEWPGRP